MIFVSLGTQDKSFTRLLDCLERSDIDEEIIVQSGYTDYVSKKMKIYKYIDKNELDEYIEKADVVICHAGVGTILSAIEKGKKVLACPRLKKYGEHTNDHQLQITSSFKEMGYILDFQDGDDIKEKLVEIRQFNPKNYCPNNANFIKKMEEYLGIVL